MNIAIPNWSAANDRLNGQIRFVSLTQNIQPSHDVIAPSDIQAGDLLFYIDCCNETISDATPTGFTADWINSSGDHRLKLSSKLADGTEASSTLTGFIGANQTSATLLVFRVSPVAANGIVVESGDRVNFTTSDPAEISSGQINLSTQWKVWPGCVCLSIWHSSPTVLTWTDVTGDAGDLGGGALQPSAPWVPATSDETSAPAQFGNSVDITNSGTNFGLLLTYVTRDAGLANSLFVGQAIFADMSDVGDANAIIAATYTPTIPGA